MEKTTFRSVFANNSVLNLHFMKVSTENDNNFGHEKITIVVDNIPLSLKCSRFWLFEDISIFNYGSYLSCWIPFLKSTTNGLIFAHFCQNWQTN